MARNEPTRVDMGFKMTSLTRPNYKCWFRLSLLGLCLFLMGAGAVLCQVDTGSISGTVSDPAGAALSGAKITIVAVATNREQTVTRIITAATPLVRCAPVSTGSKLKRPALKVCFARKSCCRFRKPPLSTCRWNWALSTRR